MTRKPILDRGYIELIEHWGSDERIIEAARMSTGKGFLGWDPGPCDVCRGTGKATGLVLVTDANVKRLQVEFLGHVADPPRYEDTACLACEGKGQLRGDAKLLKYLYENWHHTPFEMAGAIFEVQAPIETFRQWQRHRTWGYNEMSARYVPLPDENYLPTIDRLLVGASANKQAGAAAGATVLTHAAALDWLTKLAEVYDHAESVYKEGIRIGVPKELARLPVPVARYSRMRATSCLRNLLAFITLRSDWSLRGKHAQFEIRQYANTMGTILGELYPRTWELFVA
jgi:thymidylate synthase (FAD)